MVTHISSLSHISSGLKEAALILDKVKLNFRYNEIKFLDFDLDKMLEESFELGVIKDHFEGILKAVRSLRWV